MNHHDKTNHNWFARWREHRRTKRQAARERESHQQDGLTRAYADADNRAKRWSSYGGGPGGGPTGM